MGIIAWIVLGLIAGWLAGQVMRGGGYGLVGDIVLGIIGALVGGFLASTLLGLDVTGLNVMSILIAFVGACIVIAISRAVTRGRTTVYEPGILPLEMGRAPSSAPSPSVPTTAGQIPLAERTDRCGWAFASCLQAAPRARREGPQRPNRCKTRRAVRTGCSVPDRLTVPVGHLGHGALVHPLRSRW